MDFFITNKKKRIENGGWEFIFTNNQLLPYIKLVHLYKTIN